MVKMTIIYDASEDSLAQSNSDDNKLKQIMKESTRLLYKLHIAGICSTAKEWQIEHIKRPRISIHHLLVLLGLGPDCSNTVTKYYM